MTAGLWAGFGLGILMTRDSVPDAKYQKNNGTAPMTTTPSAPRTTRSYAPFLGAQGQIGLMAAGSW
jgi:hypothetical protein